MRLGKENQSVTLEEIRPFLLFLVIALMIAGPVLSDMERSREPVRFASKPVSSAEFGDRRFQFVDQIVEAGEYLYILPDEQEGFIQVYDLKGVYQHSLFFTEISNGVFVMAYEDGLFYVQNQTGDVYVFRDEEFREYVKRTTAKEQFAHIGFVWQGSTPGYKFRGNDLWRISDENEMLLIPDLVTFDTQAAVIVLSVLLCLGVFWKVVSYLKRRRINF